MTTERVIKVLAAHLEMDESEITADTTMEELDVDSLDTVEILMEMEDEFNEEISDEVAEQLGDEIRGFQIRHNLETFKLPLFFAWQAYKYGWHTDWCEEGDSLFPFMMFEIDLKKNIKKLIDQLQSESPFAQIERNSAITNTLISIYTAFINDIDDGTIKI